MRRTPGKAAGRGTVYQLIPIWTESHHMDRGMRATRSGEFLPATPRKVLQVAAPLRPGQVVGRRTTR